MNMFELTRDYTIPAALSLLPAKMDSPQAWGLLLAIAGQETDFRHRVQVVWQKNKAGELEQADGPARSLWQFEQPTVGLVLAHPGIGPIAKDVAARLLYQPEAWKIHSAMAHNDVLACVFARLLLWPDPRPLPEEHEQDAAWECYARVWRPGKPHPNTWAANWARAWGRA